MTVFVWVRKAKRAVALAFMFCMALVLLTITVSPASRAYSQTFRAPEGDETATFKITIEFNNVEQLSGIQLDFVSSDIDNLKLVGIDWAASNMGSTVRINPVLHDNRYAFGVFTASNILTGNYWIVLNVSYSGSEDQTFTITELSYAQYNHEGRPSWAMRSYDHAVFNFTRESDPVLHGDVNGDGVIDYSDVTLLLQHLAKWDVGHIVNTNNADVNGDGVIDYSDVTLLLQYLAKWDVRLGVRG